MVTQRGLTIGAYNAFMKSGLKFQCTPARSVLLLGVAGLWLGSVAMLLGFLASLKPIGGSLLERPIYETMTTQMVVGSGLFLIAILAVFANSRATSSELGRIAKNMRIGHETTPRTQLVTILLILSIPVVTLLVLGASLELWFAAGQSLALLAGMGAAAIVSLVALIVFFKFGGGQYRLPLLVGVSGLAVWLSQLLLLAGGSLGAMAPFSLVVICLNLIVGLYIGWSLTTDREIAPAASPTDWEL